MIKLVLLIFVFLIVDLPLNPVLGDASQLQTRVTHLDVKWKGESLDNIMNVDLSEAPLNIAVIGELWNPTNEIVHVGTGSTYCYFEGSYSTDLPIYDPENSYDPYDPVMSYMSG